MLSNQLSLQSLAFKGKFKERNIEDMVRAATSVTVSRVVAAIWLTTTIQVKKGYLHSF